MVQSAILGRITDMSLRSSAKQRPSRALRFLSAAAFAAMLGVWAVGSWVGERWWPCAIVTYIPQAPFGMPPVILFAWALWLRDGRSVLLNFLTLAVFLFGPMGYRIRPEKGHDSPILRVMTYNIRGGTWNLDKVLATIRHARPDVLCLQEARTNTATGSSDLEARIRSGLPGYVGYRKESIMTLCRTDTVEFGHETLMAGRRSRPLVWAEVRAGPRTVTVANVHFVLSSPIGSAARIGLRRYTEEAIEVRMAQAKALLAAVRRRQGPIIVCGDFNTPPRGIVYGMLADAWTDAAGSVGSGFGYTFASPMPVLRIDYVWLSSDLRAVRTSVPASTGSDHRPVVADIALTSRP